MKFPSGYSTKPSREKLDYKLYTAAILRTNWIWITFREIWINQDGVG